MADPIVSVLLTHHLDACRPYLSWAIEGVMRSKGVPFELIVLADSETKPDVPEGVQLIWDKNLNTGTKKINHGVEIMNAPNLLIHSDDVVLSETALFYLVHMANNQPIIQGVMSNSDIRGRYITPLELEKEGSAIILTPDMDMEDMAGWKKELFEFASPFVRQPFLMRQDYVCFFCTFMSKDTFRRVGPLDDDLDARHNDQDYCARAARYGVSTWINFSAFAFHFGSKTLNISASQEMRDEASRKFAQKIANNKEVYGGSRC